MTFSSILLVITALCNAVMAGIFFAFSSSVMPGLKRLSDIEFLKAMQSINRAIQNPIFFVVFFGALLLLPICTFLNYEKPLSTRFWLLLAATIIYLAGAFGITVLGNIPLNETLDKIDLLKAPAETISMHRINFEERWNNLNTVRTIASAISMLLVVIACLNPFKNS